MTQEQLVQEYKRIIEEETVYLFSPYKQFSNYVKLFMPLQQGCADESNYFDNTVALFEEVDKPDREADYGSESGSQYWYCKKGVVRGSDHWGNGVSNCDWALKLKTGRTTYGVSFKAPKSFKKRRYGFVAWDKFILKPELDTIDGREVLTTFENKIGRDTVVVDGKKYRSHVEIVWEIIE